MANARLDTTPGVFALMLCKGSDLDQPDIDNNEYIIQVMSDLQTDEVQCPCCLCTGTVASAEGQRPCPLCEGYTTVPPEIAQRFLEIAARRLPGGQSS